MKSGGTALAGTIMLGLMLFPFSLLANAEVSVKVEVDRAFATIGDQINFRVTATHEPGVTVLGINPGSALADFEIKQATDFSTQEKDQILEGKNFVITNYELGEYMIRSFSVQYRDASGDVKEIKTNSLYVTIESVDKNKKPESDIRGVKGVQKIKPALWPWFLLLAILGIAAGFFFFFEHSKRALLQSAQEEILSPHDEAYQALNRLQHSDLIRKGQMKLYFLHLSEILRRYFERRYQIRALELTTYELKNAFKDRLSAEQRQLIDDVLSFCDLAKFAKYIPTPLEIIRQNNQAKLVIDQTREPEIRPEAGPKTPPN
ncbi:MAG TPA: hypothetical protein VJA00_02350 [Candidatus Omnitrophota bacterium]|nr:hypothetical protein [Candidatus Omnitrophota bacterium]